MITHPKIATATLLAVAATAAGTADAELFLGFEDQTGPNTDKTFFTGQAGESTAVDQFNGMAGDGWTTGWQVQTGGSNQREKRVSTPFPLLPGGGNYLQLRHQENDSTNTRRFYLSRGYDGSTGLNLSEAAVIEFYYRVDLSNAFAGGGATFVDIRGGGSNIFSLDGNRWSIRTTGGTTKRWTVADGDGSGTFGGTDFVDSGIQLNDNNIYKFTIISDPTTETWDVTIDNVSDPAAAFSITDLGYVDSASTLGGTLLFGSQILGVDGTPDGPDPGATSQYNFSLDNISITAVPEPASGLLLGLGALAMLRRRKG